LRAIITTKQQVARGGRVFWMILILIVAVGYEAFDAANRFTGLTPHDTFHRER